MKGKDLCLGIILIYLTRDRFLKFYMAYILNNYNKINNLS
jgi:hypothetical protein